MTANEQILRDALAAWNEGDLDRALGYLAPDVRWETSGAFPGLDAVYHGPDGVRRFWSEFRSPWQEIELEVLELSEPRPDRVLAKVKFRASGRQGIEVDLELWQLYVMKGGQLAFFRPYLERAEALTAAAEA
jgi:ketosteroid isomerase-like protein